MNKKLLGFLDDVCVHIRCKAVHENIREELTNHIYELQKEYEIAGHSEEESLDMAITTMGDADDIGNKLDKQHKPKTEWSIIILATIISLIGGIIMFVSSSFQDRIAVDFVKYISFVVIGVIVMIGMYFFDYTKLEKIAMPVYIGTIVLLVLTLIISDPITGSRRFFSIGNITISAEYSALFFLIAFVGFMEKFRNQNGYAIIKLIGIAFVSVLPLILMSYLSVVFILLICYTVLIITAVIRNYFTVRNKVQLLSLGGLGIVLFGFLIFVVIPDRIITFLSRG